jgi:hypothetical protein
MHRMTALRIRALAPIAWFLLLPPAPAWGADVALKERDQIAFLLSANMPCCVIDARAEKARRQEPLPEALVYRKGLRISPTGPVVVIADSDARALGVGRAIARSSGASQVVAVKGGAATWLAAKSSVAGSPGWVSSFVIPRDTCQQGEPLQTLRPGKP